MTKSAPMRCHFIIPWLYAKYMKLQVNNEYSKTFPFLDNVCTDTSNTNINNIYPDKWDFQLERNHKIYKSIFLQL